MARLGIRQASRVGMAPVSSLVISSLLALSACHASSSPQVLAAVAFVNQGEIAPSQSSQQVILTPLGAQQLLRQGAAFRNRYLGAATRNSTASNITETAPIQSLSADTLDNGKLNIMTGTSAWLVSGATAFMQGLYPPTRISSNDTLAYNYDYVQDPHFLDYPLNGYQYARIMTYTNSDSDSIVVHGDQACRTWQLEMIQALPVNPSVLKKVQGTQDFYSSLGESGSLRGLFQPSDLTFLNAYGIYQKVKFQYQHNATVNKNLADANATLNTLAGNAFAVELFSAASSNNDTSDPTNVLYSIAGRTLANKVLDLFSSFIQTGGNGTRLTVIFGSDRPMLSLFSLVGLLHRENPSPPFSQIPGPGSSIVFELVGDGTSVSSTERLQVRFYYRPSADVAEQFTPYPLFGSGPDGQVISYDAFLPRMKDLARNSHDWCKICKPAKTSTFCHSAAAGGGNYGWHGLSTRDISASVAGVLGAILMLIITGIGIAVLMIIGGWRFVRTSGQNHDRTGGGFKGRDALARDADASISKSGLKEQRVGSWELRDGGKETPRGSNGAGIVTSDFAHKTKRVDDDGVSMTGTPINARECV